MNPETAVQCLGCKVDDSAELGKARLRAKTEKSMARNANAFFKNMILTLCLDFITRFHYIYDIDMILHYNTLHMSRLHMLHITLHLRYI